MSINAHCSCHPLAGFELSPGAALGVLAVVSLVVVLVLIFVSLFTAHLVSSAHALYQRGMLRHPWLVIGAPMAALTAAFEYRGHSWTGPVACAALVFGYGVMLRAGTSWFRWTALPATLIVIALSGGIG